MDNILNTFRQNKIYPYLPQRPAQIGNYKRTLIPKPLSSAKTGTLNGRIKFTTNGALVSVDSDWDDISTSSIEYVSDNVVKYKDSNISNIIQIGDKVLVKQTTDKYFYVTDVDTSTNYVTLNAGDDYTFTNGAFTRFATSRQASPSGHPIIFTFTPTVETFVSPFVYDDSANFAGGSGAAAVYFSMVGRLVNCSFAINTTAMRASATGIVVETPFPYKLGSFAYPFSTGLMVAGATSSGNTFIRYAWSDHGAPYASDTGIDISAINGTATFNSGTLNISGQLTFAL